MTRTRLLFATLLLLSQAVSGGIYRWVDENGRVHFSDRPVAEEAEQVEIRNSTPPSSGREARPATADERRVKQQKLLDVYRQEREEKAEARKKAKQEEAEREKRCAYARDRLQRYRVSRIYEPQADGSRRFYSDAERETAIANLEKQVRQSCE
jgi:hypothetical protein